MVFNPVLDLVFWKGVESSTSFPWKSAHFTNHCVCSFRTFIARSPSPLQSTVCRCRTQRPVDLWGHFLTQKAQVLESFWSRNLGLEVGKKEPLVLTWRKQLSSPEFYYLGFRLVGFVVFVIFQGWIQLWYISLYLILWKFCAASETIEVFQVYAVEMGSKCFLTFLSQEWGGEHLPRCPWQLPAALTLACWPFAFKSLGHERMGWLCCFCEQMGPWELEKREENFFWLIRVLSQHLWAYLVKKLCSSSQGLF